MREKLILLSTEENIKIALALSAHESKMAQDVSDKKLGSAQKAHELATSIALALSKAKYYNQEKANMMKASDLAETTEENIKVALALSAQGTKMAQDVSDEKFWSAQTAHESAASTALAISDAKFINQEEANTTTESNLAEATEENIKVALALSAHEIKIAQLAHESATSTALALSEAKFNNQEEANTTKASNLAEATKVNIKIALALSALESKTAQLEHESAASTALVLSETKFNNQEQANTTKASNLAEATKVNIKIALTLSSQESKIAQFAPESAASTALALSETMHHNQEEVNTTKASNLAETTEENIKLALALSAQGTKIALEVSCCHESSGYIWR